VAIVMAVEDVEDGAEVSEFQACADVFAHPHSPGLACVYLLNRKRRFSPQPQAYEEGGLLIDRPPGADK
jgi:hypothetical protein